MSKHRRPSRFARAGRIANSPLQLSIAAGVAGTVAVAGTVMASAAPTEKPKAGKETTRPVVEQTVVEQTTVVDAADLASVAAALTLKDAVAVAQQERAERIAAAKARAIAKRKAAKAAKELAAKRAHERAHERADAARTLSSASRGGERLSGSASTVMQAAAAVASGAYYSYGSSGPSAFDCSGYTSYVFAQMGISLPRTSSAQRAATTPVSSPQPGDLVFVYNGGGGSIGHVGIYAGGGQWWEASNPSSGVGLHGAWSSAVSYGRVL